MDGSGEHSRSLSLQGMHGTVIVPAARAGFWRNWRAFAGPALLVSVGYMDPGNWGTDLQAGAQFQYRMMWVVALASLMAIFLQVISARLGVVTGKDLAQACRDWYPRWTRWPNWLACEVAIGACDLAEVLGSAVAINLLTHGHVPLLFAVIITAFDVLLLLMLEGMGMRKIEAVVGVLVFTIAACYAVEIFVLPEAHPPTFAQIGGGLVPRLGGGQAMNALVIAMIGATVMPHNLYLHSALVQSRRYQRDEESIRKAIRFNTLDSTVALLIAFLINAAILVLAAMVFYGKTSVTAGGRVYELNENSDWIRIAYLTLAPLLGATIASTLFAVGLLASGQSSTITGTLAGQVVMEGFMHWRIQPWVRRVITRGLAVLPAVLIIGIRGNTNTNDLINLSQAVLALQLPLAMFPLLHFTSSRAKMGAWRLGPFLLIAGWGSALLITALDFYALPDTLKQAWQVIVGGG